MLRALPFRRALTAALTAFALILVGSMLASCGPDHEQAITDSLTQELDGIKNLDDAYLDEMASDPSIADLSSFGIDPKEFFRSYLNGFDYRIDDVTVDGETANATVVLTVKSFQEFSDGLNASLETLIADETLASMTEEDLYARVGQSVMDVLNGLQPHELAPITITYQLVDDVWTPTEDSQNAIETALVS